MHSSTLKLPCSGNVPHPSWEKSAIECLATFVALVWGRAYKPGQWVGMKFSLHTAS